MDFRIIGKIAEIEIIAIGNSIRELPALQKRFGKGRWRQLKGVAKVRCNYSGPTAEITMNAEKTENKSLYHNENT